MYRLISREARVATLQ